MARTCKDCRAEGITNSPWLPVVGYEDRYQVSRYGDVRSIDTAIIDRLGRRRRQAGRLLAQQVDDFGYHRVELSRDGHRRTFGIHRLVALAFVLDRQPEQIEVRHRDHNPGHNHADNLLWGTHQENVADTLRDGRYVNGNAIKTRCPAGHEYSGYDKRGTRKCAECRRDSTRRLRERRRAA